MFEVIVPSQYAANGPNEMTAFSGMPQWVRMSEWLAICFRATWSLRGDESLVIRLLQETKSSEDFVFVV